ncbi:MAG TPA: type II secretion system F family protein [Thermoplasmataceae archaeon]|nr:type II secretion system F family protein [Thermoplasmataceae archaeon]
MFRGVKIRALAGIEFSRRDVILAMIFAVVSGIGLALYLVLGNIYYSAISAIGASGILYIILKPILDRDAAKSNINSNIPYFITAFATLSVSAANRIDLLEILSNKEKLGKIADELKKLVNLVKNWKRGLSEAAMFLSKRSPSEVFEDFLARFGHAINSGQDFEEFVKNEAETVMNNFETAYISALYGFDLYKDMYVSLLLAFAFMVTFVMIMPILIPISIVSVLSLSLIAISLGELMLVYGIKMVLPNDPIWHDTGIKTDLQMRIERLFILAAIASGIIIAVFFGTGYAFRVPFYIVASIVVTPLAWPSYVGSREERKVAKKDEMFGSFIRSLSGSASARGNMIIDALKAIVLHDFGMLTQDIKNLYKRLVYRINNIESWKFFSADTGSHLIEVFSASFVESVELGADSAKAGQVVADNFDRVIRLRKRRHASVSSYIGVVYGITGGLAFSLAIAFGVLEIINQVFSTFNISTLNSFGIFVSQPPSAIFTIEAFIVVILYVHALIAGIALKVADGGKVLHSLHHFVIMSWIISAVVYGTLYLTQVILGGAL